MGKSGHVYNGVYRGDNLNRIAFPLGGIGAGMICIEGTGTLSHVSLRNKPDVFSEPFVFSAVCVRGEPNVARVLEGPVPAWKAFGRPGSGNGANDKSYGFPHCRGADFLARFPFGIVALQDPKIPLEMKLTGWSPFVPGDADSSSLPVAALEYCFMNRTAQPVDAVYSFHAANFMSPDANAGRVEATKGGFVLRAPGSGERPWDEGAFSVVVDGPDVAVNCAWFRGGWFDARTLLWRSIQEGETPSAETISEGGSSPGGSLYVPLRLAPGEGRTIRLHLAWYVPETDLRAARCSKDEDRPLLELERHVPWYAGEFVDMEAVNAYWLKNCDVLREKSTAFSNCFYDSTLPDEVVEAVAANLTILKSPTILRQKDGRLWCWEGCRDTSGCCAGSCTHVWNYAQALPHLFPCLERSLRHTEFEENQDERGHQAFRASLPIRPAGHDFHAAADGQLGGIMKVHRDWRIGGDTDWLRELWPKVRKSLEYCIETWDPDHKGVLVEPHHNTFDIEFWGANGMCTSFYLGALRAAVAMGDALGEDVALLRQLLEKGRIFMEKHLFDGEYFFQEVQWRGLRAADPRESAGKRIRTSYTPEAVELLEKEGPKYQYGRGCLSDGVLGAWMAAVCGVHSFLDEKKVESHLTAVYRYNLRRDLSEHANPQRSNYALGEEGGLLLCSWPKGGSLSLPFVYSNEVWTGIEYQVASHLMMTGHIEEGLDIVRTARNRYDGRARNPFNEYECGHWYARAMSSYGLIQGLTGIRYDAAEKILYVRPVIKGDFRSFLSTATGFGTAGVRNGSPFVEVKSGTIAVGRVVYDPAGSPAAAS